MKVDFIQKEKKVMKVNLTLTLINKFVRKYEKTTKRNNSKMKILFFLINKMKILRDT